ncbi:MAG: amidohydrolase family protein, partial [Acidimicrobiales bacterium]|nr:amidohydrolase family protein [Acidimicrobiales bacterium]
MATASHDDRPTARILRGLTVLAPERLDPTVDAIGLVGPTIVAVGRSEDVAAALPSDAEVADLHGATAVPGFIDAHLHPLPQCFFEHHVDLSPCRSMDDVGDLLSQRAAAVDDGEWVFGLQLDPELLAERRVPGRRDLDRAGGGRPTVVLQRDGHHAIGSTAA